MNESRKTAHRVEANKGTRFEVPFKSFFVSDLILTNALVVDASTVTTDTMRYCKVNKFQYSLVIELWASLFEQYARNSVRGLLITIMDEGLIGTIKLADQASKQLIDHYSKGDQLFSDNKFIRLLPETDDLQLLLQLCRFAKRFSPIGADILNEKAMLGFSELQAQLRGWRRKLGYSEPGYTMFFPEHPEKIRNYGRPILGDLCDAKVGSFTLNRILDRLRSKIAHWISSHSKAKWYRICYELGSFSNGGTFSDQRVPSTKTLAYKVNQLASTMPNLYGVPLTPVYSKDGVSPFDVDKYTIKVSAVPKSWKGPRLIAPEHPYVNWWLSGMRKAIYSDFPRKELFDAENQDPNREACRLASLTWNEEVNYATIDHTAASDSIIYWIMEQILPEGFIEFLNDFRAKRYQDGHLWTFLTSGNPLTFMLEGIFFLALAMVATEYASLWLTGEDHGELLLPKVFGDDLLIDSRAVETYLSMASLLGITVNEDKSFMRGDAYRESCGVEFLMGADSATLYWPRSEIRPNSTESLASLISLQQRLFFVSEDTAVWLAHILRENQKITGTSPMPVTPQGIPYALDEVTDLIERNPIVVTTTAPHKGKLNVAPDRIHLYQRELHSTFGTDADAPYGRVPNVEAYLYAMYLREGPQYEDPLMELLRVSMPINRDNAISVPKPSMKLKER